MNTQHENLILQSYFTVSLLAELGNNKFFSSEYFKSMSFGSPDVKSYLGEHGVNNPGSVIMSLYAMLVVPYETIRDNYADEFDTMNVFLAKKTKNVTTNYKDNVADSDFMYHLRNAVAHCRLELKDADSIVFTDSNRAEKPSKKKEFYGELPLVDLSAFIHQLQLVIQMKVIKNIQARS